MKFLYGLALGFAGALLFAPARGEQTRRRILREAHEFAGKHLHEAAEKVTEVAREKAGEIGSAVGRQAAESAVESILGHPETRGA